MIGCWALLENTLCCFAGCIAKMPGYVFHQGKTVDCSRYPDNPSCSLGPAGPQLLDMIQACNLDPKCLAVATNGQMKVRVRLPRCPMGQQTMRHWCFTSHNWLAASSFCVLLAAGLLARPCKFGCNAHRRGL